MTYRDAEMAEQRWALVAARAERDDFVYAVASTGIYCRPACPARRPLRKNVEFYATPQAAELAGFRACKRCRPKAPNERGASRPVVAMCRLLEKSAASPSLRALAAQAGLSESYAHRLFVKTTGLTPRAYREAVLRRRARAELAAQPSVTEAIYAAGFQASSRFYDKAARALGMQPSQYRKGASGITIQFACSPCSLGWLLVAATPRGICAVSLGDERALLERELRAHFRQATLVVADDSFQTTLTHVIRVIESAPGADPSALPLDLQGSVFQERVWRALQRVPSGARLTYAELAAAIGAPSASRAVARACATNRTAVLIPCHRVVRSDGSLAGYRWGIERKRELLRRESEPR